MARVVLDQAAINALATDPQILAAIRSEVAEPIAADIRGEAPKRTGRGAASIHVEPADQPGDGFEVGPDPDHFYMRFPETGTHHQPAHPYAVPVAERFGGRRT